MHIFPRQVLLKTALLTSLIGASGCAAPADQPQSDMAAQTSQAQAAKPAAALPARPSYATALERNFPQGVVKSTLRAMPAATQDADLAAALDGFVADTQSYGILVWHDGRLIYEQYGDGFDADIRSESASMAKSVLALVVGAAIDDGHIGSVDDRVGTYIRDWDGDARGDITVRNLLEMASGLQPLSFEGGMQSIAWEFITKGPRARQIALGQTLAAEPGSVYHYQNSVSQLIGLIVENATGMVYQDYASQQVWQPLGAADARVWLNEAEGFPRTYMGFYARPRDWVRLGRLVKDLGSFEGTQIISSDYIEQMTAPSAANPNYGWQVWRGATYQPQRFYNDAKIGFSVTASAPFSVDDIIYFDGFGGQRVYTSRSQDLVIVRLGEERFDWDDSALPNTVLGVLAQRATGN